MITALLFSVVPRNRILVSIALIVFLASINVYNSLRVNDRDVDAGTVLEQRNVIVSSPLSTHEKTSLGKNQSLSINERTVDSTTVSKPENQVGGASYEASIVNKFPYQTPPSNRNERLKWERTIYQASQPPVPLQLFENVDNPFVRQRHECIAQIRQRHYEILGPYFEKATRETVLLVDPAEHKNVGDNMLAHAEKVFLQHYGIQDPIKCRYVQANMSPKCDLLRRTRYKNNMHIPHQAMWHAGGNFGDLYQIVHQQRLQSFPWLLQSNFTIVGMPQSLYYSNNKVALEDANNFRRMVETAIPAATNNWNASQSRMILTWRELISYHTALELYPFAKNWLVPDIAFQLGPYAPDRSPGLSMVDVLLFLRDDKESVIQPRNSTPVESILSRNGYANVSFRIVDWKDRLPMFNTSDFFFTQTAIQLLSLGRVVIADRLHACILCYLSGIPFVYIEPLTGKISRSLEVAFNLTSDSKCMDGTAGMWAKGSNLEEGLNIAIQFLETNKFR